METWLVMIHFLSEFVKILYLFPARNKQELNSSQTMFTLAAFLSKLPVRRRSRLVGPP